MLTLFNSSEMTVETKLAGTENSGIQIWKSNSGEDKTQLIGNKLKIPAWGTVVIRIE